MKEKYGSVFEMYRANMMYVKEAEILGLVIDWFEDGSKLRNLE